MSAQKASYPVISITSYPSTEVTSALVSSMFLFLGITDEHASLIHFKIAMVLQYGSEFFSRPMYPYFDI